MQLNLRILWPNEKNGYSPVDLGARALQLGYNGVVSSTPCKGTAWIKEAASIEDFESHPDYFLCSSRWKEENFFQQPGNERWTRAELVSLEMEQLEQKLPRGAKLIFCLPGEEKIEWVHHLSKRAGPKTLLAFSPYAGGPTYDFLPPQPLWKKIIEGEEFCSTPLLPILNTGMVNQGGGLWPTLPFDLFDRFYCHIPAIPFQGALTLTHAVPRGPGFLHCALWVGAHLLQREEAPDKKLAEWFYRYKSTIDYLSAALLLRNLRTLALETTVLRYLKGRKVGNDESRSMLEGLNAKIQALHYAIEREQPLLLDPFKYFVRDVRRSMSHFATQHNVSYSVHQDEALESFWTYKSGSQAGFYTEPNRGQAGSKQESIFMENWE